MCTTCGCSSLEPLNSHDSNPSDAHHAQHTHHHAETNARLLEVEQDLLSRNNRYAEQNRTVLRTNAVLALNLVSSPGAGKTTLLVETIKAMNAPDSIGVIEGDQQTDLDAQRIAATGAASRQLNTGKGCHLDAHAVGHAIEHFPLDQLDTLFIENVGNLVCPAAFDLGEFAKVVVLSVTEGDDKPLKYPDMFKASALMLINKTDLLPYVDFDVTQAIEYARRINPSIEVIQLSAKTHEGFDHWLEWLKKNAPNKADTQDAIV
jgi:hydrogenase nickel incorporation protein HypB